MIRLLPPANEVWGKVMFLHMSAILFIGEAGLYDVTSCLAPWSHVPSRGSLSLVPCSFQGGLCLWFHVPSRMVLCLGVSLDPPTQRLTPETPWTETPLDRDTPIQNTPMDRDTPPDRDPPLDKRPLLDRDTPLD